MRINDFTVDVLPWKVVNFDLFPFHSMLQGTQSVVIFGIFTHFW